MATIPPPRDHRPKECRGHNPTDAGQAGRLNPEKDCANEFVMNWPQRMLKRLCARMQFRKDGREKIPGLDNLFLGHMTEPTIPIHRD